MVSYCFFSYGFLVVFIGSSRALFLVSLDSWIFVLNVFFWAGFCFLLTAFLVGDFRRLSWGVPMCIFFFLGGGSSMGFYGGSSVFVFCVSLFFCFVFFNKGLFFGISRVGFECLRGLAFLSDLVEFRIILF